MSTTQSSNGFTQYEYDEDGRPTRVTRPDNSYLQPIYDFAGRLESLTLNDEDTLATYYYGTSGALNAIDGPVAGTRVSFSHDGPLLTETKWSGILGDLRVHHAYDADLRLGCECLNGACTFANGACSGAGVGQVAFGYDTDGLLTSAGELAIARDPDNGLMTRATVGAVYESFETSTYGELAGLVAKKDDPITGDELLSVDYTRDALGRIVEQVETIATAGGPWWR